jgi:hypothetical protein
MDERLQQILFKLAKRHAPQLLQTRWASPPPLARSLASYNILVLVGEAPGQAFTTETGARVQTWADGYVRLYSLLAHHLFPSFTHVNAQYADHKLPIVIAIKGAATPVIQVLAGFVSPYIVLRQGQAQVSEVELLGLMDTVLDELEAGDLPREEYKYLRAEGAGLLKEMLMSPVRQIRLTEFDRPLFSDIPQPPAPVTPPPREMPETLNLPAKVEPVIAQAPPAPEIVETDESLFDTTTSMPVFFSRKPATPKKRRPPVPSLPDEGE